MATFASAGPVPSDADDSDLPVTLLVRGVIIEEED